MAKVTIGRKACAVNPLKMSQPIGGALAFMGLRGRCRCFMAPGVHVVWIGSFRSAFQGGHSASDDRDERGCDRPWRA